MVASQFPSPAVYRVPLYRYLDTVGGKIDPEEICITNGGQEALLLALKAVAGKGDVIAVESPTYHGLLELIDSLGMLAIEVETCPEEGITLSALRKTLEAHPVKVCMFSTTCCVRVLTATQPTCSSAVATKSVRISDMAPPDS